MGQISVINTAFDPRRQLGAELVVGDLARRVVPLEKEREGLDISDHGERAYTA